MPVNIEQHIAKMGGGLQPTPVDVRDFQLGAIYPQPKIEELPYHYMLEGTVMKDQKLTDLCTAYASTSASEKQENQVFSPEWQFAMTKRLEGDWTTWGANLRTAMMSFVKFGSLPQYVATGWLHTHEKDKYDDRDWLANWKNWATVFEDRAAEYKKRSVFKNNGRYDLFDNMCTWLWHFRDEHRSFVVGALWRDDWTDAPDGVIPKEYGAGQYGHAFEIVGFNRQDDTLIAKLSNGDEIGKDGYFHFPRSVVNKEFAPYGQFMFQDMPKDLVREYEKKGIKATDSLFVRIIKSLVYFFKSL